MLALINEGGVMRIWHACKTSNALHGILYDKKIRLGINISNHLPYAHVSDRPFVAGEYALDVIGEDTNEAWVIEAVIPDEIPLIPDPSTDRDMYGGGWLVAESDIPISQVIGIIYISNVQHWEARKIRATPWK